VAVNKVENDSGLIHFVASRLSPAGALNGDLVLATVHLRLLEGDLADALWMSDVTLADEQAREINVVWHGLDISARPTERIYLPNLYNEAADQG
jgi:urease accessory protein UreF